MALFDTRRFPTPMMLSHFLGSLAAPKLMVLRITNLRAEGLLPDNTLVGGLSERQVHVSVRLRNESRSTQPVPDAPVLVWRDELVFDDQPAAEAQFLFVKGAGLPRPTCAGIKHCRVNLSVLRAASRPSH